ncbi:MAG: hypothetical protein NC484_03695 [Alloprevotella sp.]|nr:hypothetical protein [Alloprevotella sp.]
MLPLTLYIYIENPVSDCGCFGDFWVISNAATFWKNLAITGAVIFLWRYNSRLQPLFTPYSQWIVITLLGAYLLIVGLYGYNIQPMIDFRSFPVGSSLIIEDDTDDDDDIQDVTFIYEKGAIRKEFTIDSLPDSTWTFIESNEHPEENWPKTELAVYNTDGIDATADAIRPEGDEIILVIPQPARAEISWTYFLNELQEFMAERGGDMAAFIAGGPDVADYWADIAMASYPVYTAESTTLKELARGNMSLVYLHDGRVVWKRSMAMIDTTTADAMLFEGNNSLAEMAHDGPSIFRWLSALLIFLLFILYIFDSTGRMIKYSILDRRSSMDESN